MADPVEVTEESEETTGEEAQEAQDTPEARLEEARGLQSQGEHAAALEILNGLLQTLPDSWEVKFRRANSLAVEGNTLAAYDAWKAVLNAEDWDAQRLQGEFGDQLSEALKHVAFETTFDETNPRPCYLHAKIAELFGQPDTVRHALTKTVQRDPDHQDAMDWFMRVHAGDEDKRLVYGLLEQAYETHPESPALNCQLGEMYYQQNKFAHAIRHLQHALKLTNGNNWQAQFTLGRIFLKQQRYDEADAALDRAQTMRPSEFSVVMARIQVAKQLYQFDRALTLLESAISINPEDSQLKIEHATLCTQMGALDRAVPGLELALQANPGDPQVELNLAKAYAASGQPAKAVPLLKKAVEAQPSGNLYSVLGEALTQLGQGEPALEAYRKAVELDPDIPAYRLALGKVLMTLGKTEEGVTALEEAARADANNVTAQLTLAAAYQKAGQLEKTLETYKAASQLDPDRVDIYLQMGMVGLAADKLDEAVSSFKDVMRLSSKPHPMALAGLAQVYQKKGFAEAAIDFYKQSLMADPNQRAAAQAISEHFLQQNNRDELRSVFRETFDAHQRELVRAGALVGAWKSFLEAREEFELCAEMVDALRQRSPHHAEVKKEQERLYMTWSASELKAERIPQALWVLEKLAAAQSDNADVNNRLSALRARLGPDVTAVKPAPRGASPTPATPTTAPAVPAAAAVPVAAAPVAPPAISIPDPAPSAEAEEPAAQPEEPVAAIAEPVPVIPPEESSATTEHPPIAAETAPEADEPPPVAVAVAVPDVPEEPVAVAEAPPDPAEEPPTQEFEGTATEVESSPAHEEAAALPVEPEASETLPSAEPVAAQQTPEESAAAFSVPDPLEESVEIFSPSLEESPHEPEESPHEPEVSSEDPEQTSEGLEESPVPNSGPATAEIPVADLEPEPADEVLSVPVPVEAPAVAESPDEEFAVATPQDSGEPDSEPDPVVEPSIARVPPPPPPFPGPESEEPSAEIAPEPAEVAEFSEPAEPDVQVEPEPEPEPEPVTARSVAPPPPPPPVPVVAEEPVAVAVPSEPAPVRSTEPPVPAPAPPPPLATEIPLPDTGTTSATPVVETKTYEAKPEVNVPAANPVARTPIKPQTSSIEVTAKAPSDFVRRQLFSFEARQYHATQQHLWERSMGEYLLANAAMRAPRAPRPGSKKELSQLYLRAARSFREIGWLEEAAGQLHAGLLRCGDQRSLLTELREVIYQWVDFLEDEKLFDAGVQLLEGLLERGPSDDVQKRLERLFKNWTAYLRGKRDPAGAQALLEYLATRTEQWDKLKQEWDERAPSTPAAEPVARDLKELGIGVEDTPAPVAAPEPVREPEPEPVVEEPGLSQPGSAVETAPEAEPEPVPVAETAPEAEAPELELDLEAATAEPAPEAAGEVQATEDILKELDDDLELDTSDLGIDPAILAEIDEELDLDTDLGAGESTPAEPQAEAEEAKSEPEPEPVAEPEPEPVPEPEPEFPQATMDLETCVERVNADPKDEEAVNSALAIYADDKRGCVRFFRERVSQNADEPHHVLNLARAYSKTGADTLAVIHYQKYLRILPSDWAFEELAQVYDRLGKDELAQETRAKIGG